MTNLDSILKYRDITLPTKVHLVKAMVFPVVMYRYESRTIKKAEHLKNWYFWNVVLDKTLERPLDCKEIKPINPRGNQPWKLIRRTGAKAPIFWPPDVKTWLIRKDPDAGKDWGQKEKGTTEDEMIGWYYPLIRHIAVQLLSHIWPFVSPWTAAYQASLSFTISWSLLKFISVELVMSSNHLILCRPLLFLERNGQWAWENSRR